jgi:DNA-binding response OmpR family regulator
VEDDVATSRLLSHALGRGYAVETVNNGLNACATALEFRPDVVLLDVNLPGANGFRVAQQMKAHPELRRAVIIFVTACDRPLDAIRGIQVGARHYVTKPFHLLDLTSKVRRAAGLARAS